MLKNYFLKSIFPGILPLIILLFIFGSRSYSQVNEKNSENDTITLRIIHNELDSAGEWVKVTKDQIDPEERGNEDIDVDVNIEYVWVPHYNVIDPEWNPYSYGQWIWCDIGWTWYSYYSWGWLPYHYGRWWFWDLYGWVWSPGYAWAPCWVDWYWGCGYVGWYPISPWHNWYWHNGYVINNHHPPPHKRNHRKWTFVREEDFNKKITKQKLANEKEKNQIFADNTKVDPKQFEKGPNVKDFEKVTGEKINAKTIVLASDNQKVTYNHKTFKNRNDVDADKKVVKSETDPIKNNQNSRKSNSNSKINSNSNTKSNTNYNKKSGTNSNNKSNVKSNTRSNSNTKSPPNKNGKKSSYNGNSRSSDANYKSNYNKSYNNNNNSKGNNNRSSYNTQRNSGNHYNSSSTRSSNSGSHNRSSNSGSYSRSSNNGSHRSR